MQTGVFLKESLKNKREGKGIYKYAKHLYDDKFRNDLFEGEGILKYPVCVMKASLKNDKEKEKEFINMQTRIFMEVNLKIIKRGKMNFKFASEAVMKANLKKTKEKEKEFTKASLKIIKKKEKEFTKASLKIIKEKETSF